ncbi:hypothetical protein GGS26DRAFT_95998 [Hypomontagnella submonticulosa]|nr:hypothetical protein GGS26DRAFT_95998 [Hypomontagnella submonticulosa]
MSRTVTATTVCYVDECDPSVRTYFELIATYDAILLLNVVSRTFLDLNKTNDPSIYWGYSVLNVYWRVVMQIFFGENMLKASPPFFEGVISPNPNLKFTGAIEDKVTETEFSKVDARFFIPRYATGIASQHKWYCNSTSITKLADNPGHLAAFNRPISAIWRSVAVLRKAM